MKTHGWKNVVYKAVDEMPKNMGTYDNKEWISKQIDRVNNFDKEVDMSIKRNKVLIDLVKNIKKEKIVIVDIGGGFGLTYIPLKKETSKSLDYKIIEGKHVSNAANIFFEDNNELSFFSKIEKIKNVDIVYIRSSLQYVENWEKTVNQIINLKPEYVVFSHLAAGDINESFLTVQLWGNQEIPYWVIKEKDLKNIFLNNDYVLESKNVSEDITSNKLWETFINLSVEKQINATISLIFKRT
jgi:putative methyltransferase (TIGR04325 family)